LAFAYADLALSQGFISLPLQPLNSRGAMADAAAAPPAKGNVVRVLLNNYYRVTCRRVFVAGFVAWFHDRLLDACSTEKK
jgi:hypothetical protein